MNWRIVTVVFMLLNLAGCDNHSFTQFFRNPYIVEIAELERLEADKWYEFKTEAKALNREQSITISFKGSQVGDLDSFVRGSDENFLGGESVYVSRVFPGKEITFIVHVYDFEGVKHEFEATGQANGMVFYSKNRTLKIGNKVKRIRVKANLTHHDVKITWISRTGK